MFTTEPVLSLCGFTLIVFTFVERIKISRRGGCGLRGGCKVYFLELDLYSYVVHGLLICSQWDIRDCLLSFPGSVLAGPLLALVDLTSNSSLTAPNCLWFFQAAGQSCCLFLLFPHFCSFFSLPPIPPPLFFLFSSSTPCTKLVAMG